MFRVYENISTGSVGRLGTLMEGIQVGLIRERMLS